MKIEMGESLFYSWLRHVKECQIVQNSWKPSQQWNLANADELEGMMEKVDRHFSEKYDFEIFKKITSLSQLLKQGECDVLGISILPDGLEYYAVDVAFHEGGLNYKGPRETVMKVLEKCARTAFSLYGYLYTKKADIIFASPKINPAVLTPLLPCMEELKDLFASSGYDYNFRVIANQEYNDLVLKPILLISDGVADTSELFMRSYQMYKMFSNSKDASVKDKRETISSKLLSCEFDYQNSDAYKEMKIGQLAQRVLGEMLQKGYASDEEIEAMQTFEYSKQHFDLQYPLLKVADDTERPLRYYAKPITIKGIKYHMCSEWFEKEHANNDRPYLLRWIENHKKWKE